jgi:hypothetical protein
MNPALPEEDGMPLRGTAGFSFHPIQPLLVIPQTRTSSSHPSFTARLTTSRSAGGVK